MNYLEPELGRPLDDAPELRELILKFGDAGYVALYRYDIETKTYVLPFAATPCHTGHGYIKYWAVGS